MKKDMKEGRRMKWTKEEEIRINEELDQLEADFRYLVNKLISKNIPKDKIRDRIENALDFYLEENEEEK